jgi:predicted Zn-dependent protease with MMP-like domain
MPIYIDDDAFEHIVAEAIEQVPDELAQHMENVAVFIQEWPTAAQRRGYRGTLLGLYEGVSLTRRGPISYRNTMPDRITIFKGPHCRIARDEEGLRHRVTKTVIHEIGHHFGISDRRLRELGW